MELPHDLKILPSQAVDIIHFLAQLPDGHADAETICDGANLSDRAFGKAIRRLVTRKYLRMDMGGDYHLTPEGRKAAKLLTQIEDEQTTAAQQDAAANTTPRRLTVVMPKTVGAGAPAELFAGIDRPDAGPAAHRPTALVLRFEGVNCDITPPEHTIQVPADSAAEPATFTLTPAQAGKGRVRVRAYQVIRMDEVEEVGGMYFDFQAGDAGSADLQAISIDLDLYSA
jgi:predicted transcriptional regulator